MTRTFVLHPMACGLAFVAFLLCMGGRTLAAAFWGASVALPTWVLLLASLAVDFATFVVIRKTVQDKAKDDDKPFPSAKFGIAIWCVVGAFALQSASIVLLGIGSVGAYRDHKKNKRTSTREAAWDEERKKKVFVF